MAIRSIMPSSSSAAQVGQRASATVAHRLKSARRSSSSLREPLPPPGTPSCFARRCAEKRLAAVDSVVEMGEATIRDCWCPGAALPRQRRGRGARCAHLKVPIRPLLSVREELRVERVELLRHQAVLHGRGALEGGLRRRRVAHRRVQRRALVRRRRLGGAAVRRRGGAGRGEPRGQRGDEVADGRQHSHAAAGVHTTGWQILAPPTRSSRENGHTVCACRGNRTKSIAAAINVVHFCRTHSGKKRPMGWGICGGAPGGAKASTGEAGKPPGQLRGAPPRGRGGVPLWNAQGARARVPQRVGHN
jgi:hypothetical protein